MKRRRKSRALNLTPLIDVMTTLIIFILIQSSDSEVEVYEGIDLAKQSYGDTVKSNEKIEVSLKGLKLKNGFNIDLKQGEFSKRDLHKEENKLVVKLFNEIEKLREEKVKKGEKFDLNLSFDKRIPVESVRKVIYTATVAGVDNIFYLGERKD